MGAPPEPARSRVPVLGAACAAGVLALAAQTLLLRAELVLYGGNEVALGAFLGLWLLGITVGALAAGQFRGRVDRLATPCLLAQAALLVAAAWLAAVARELTGVPSYEPFPLTGLILWSLPIALPVAVATGATVPALAARARHMGVSVTTVYVLEAVGSFVGGLGASLLLAVGWEPGSLMLVLGAVAAAAGVFLERGVYRGCLAALSVVLALASVPLGPTLSRELRSRLLETVLPGSRLLDHAETATGSLLLASLRNQNVLLADGRVLAAFPDPERVERAAGALAALTGAPRRLLLIGAEAADLVAGLPALKGLETVSWLVPDPGFAAFVRRHVPGLAADRRIEVVAGDPLRHQVRLESQGPFDAVWLVVDTPLRRAEDRFLTPDTLGVLADLLTPDGVLAVPVRSAENYLGPRLRSAVGTVLAGVGSVLEVVRLLPGEDAWVLGARRPDLLDLSPSALTRAYADMGPLPPRIDAAGFASLLEPARVAAAERLASALRRDPAVGPSRIERPLALYHNLLVRAESEDPDLARFAEALRDRGAVLWVPLLILALFVIGQTLGAGSAAVARRGNAAWVLGLAGATGMALNLVLLHGYQGRFGTLYLEAGWLFGFWMAGLALGAGVGRRAAVRRAPAPFGVAVFAVLGAFAAVLALGGVGAGPGRALWAAAFVVAGALTGAVIPVAEAILSRAGIRGGAAGVVIEAADHLGGSVAALALGVLAIPILGLTAVGWIVAGLSVLGAVLLLPGATERGRAVPELEGGGSPLWLPLPGIARLLLALCAAAIAGHLAVRAWVAGPRVHLDAETLAATRLAAPWVERVEPVVHYRTVPGTAPAGVAFASRAAGRAQGYGGPINLLVATDEQGRVLHLELLQHRETPSYLEDLDAFLGRCVGSNLLQGFRLQLRSAGAEPGLGEGGQAVDAMTGATVTSQAVLAALETSGRRLAEPVFGTAYNSNGETGAGDRRWFALAASFLFLLPILWRAGRRARLVWLAAQAAVTGGYLGVQFSTVQTLALLRFETDWNLLGWTGLLGGGVVLLTGALGPVYCGYLCPAGAVQELLAALGRRLNVTRTLPVAVDRRARFAKYALLSAVILGALGVGSEAVEGLDLLRSVWDPNRGLWATALLALVALGSVITVRFGCRYLCPAGAFLNLANRFAPARRLLPRKRYRACDLGVRSRRELDCIHCGRCRLGETVATASPLQSRVIRAAIAVALGALVVGTQPFPFGGEPRASLLTRVEPVDAQLIRLKLAAGKLSEEPAQYWHVIRP